MRREEVHGDHRIDGTRYDGIDGEEVGAGAEGSRGALDVAD